MEDKVISRNFINGRRCLECTKTKFKTPEQYKKDIMSAGSGQFTLLSKYVLASENIKVQHTNGYDYTFYQKTTEHPLLNEVGGG